MPLLGGGGSIQEETATTPTTTAIRDAKLEASSLWTQKLMCYWRAAPLYYTIVLMYRFLNLLVLTWTLSAPLRSAKLFFPISTTAPPSSSGTLLSGSEMLLLANKWRAGQADQQQQYFVRKKKGKLSVKPVAFICNAYFFIIFSLVFILTSSVLKQKRKWLCSSTGTSAIDYESFTTFYYFCIWLC